MFFDRYPYSNFHELNLDWLIAKMKELNIAFEEFKVVNNITFSGQWDITKQYPAWTIVSDNNIGYVSIQPVPVGVVLTNTDYWVEVIDYTAQIAGLQQRVVDLENHDITQDSNITNLGNRIDDIEQLIERKYLFLGDSYYLGGTGTTYTGIGWASQVINDLGLDADHYILTPAEDVINPDLTVSYPGFYPSAGSHRSFKTILETTSSRLTDDEKESVTDIVVAGGYNDISHGSAIETGEAEFSTFAKATFPNARLWVAHIAYTTNYSVKSGLLDTIRAYRNCINYGMTYISDAEYVLSSDSFMLSDGIHPVEAGYKMIGKSIANALISGNDCYSVASSVEMTALVNDTLAGGYLAVDYGSKYGEKILSFSNMRITLQTPTLISFSAPYKIYITNDALQPLPQLNHEMFVNLHENGGGDNWQMVTMTISQDATGKYIEITPLDTTFFKTINYITIPKSTLIIPKPYM